MAERKNKQTDKQTDKQNLAGYFLEEATWFSTAISYVLNEHHGMVLKCQI